MSEDRRDEQEAFLARWSRRKALSRRGEKLPEPDTDTDTDPPATVANEQAAVEAEPPAESPGEEAGVPADAPAELPPLESLDENSDFSAFLRDGVPADVKQKALRKLFHSPKFNIRDGLDDYDWDFSNPEPLGEVITAEMRYRMRQELERLAGLDEDEESPEEQVASAAADTGEHDEPDNEVDSEANDDRSEPS